MLASFPSINDHGYHGEDLRRIDYLPSPSEIAAACQTIRAGWSLCEKRRRFVGELLSDEVETAWQPPVVDTTHFRMAIARGFDPAG
ncbi:hypothetical protein [Botrimarina hoheduenensis]|uniref:hypothetical protein n=1 Tax=Botrimarina hoheduenensis TaxID=2528000 RepID=UPI0011B80959|nr:hypothetical protein [Botrimarina hoheduenensis]